MQQDRIISTIAIAAALGGFLGFILAFDLFGLGDQAGDFGFAWGLVAMLQAAGGMVFAYATWFLKSWARRLGLGVEAFGLPVALVGLSIPHASLPGWLIAAAIAGVLFIALFRRDVRRAYES